MPENYVIYRLVAGDKNSYDGPMINAEGQNVFFCAFLTCYTKHILFTDGIDEDTLNILASDPPDGSPKKDNSYFTSTTFEGVSRILDSLVQQTCAVAPPGIVINYFIFRFFSFVFCYHSRQVIYL